MYPMSICFVANSAPYSTVCRVNVIKEKKKKSNLEANVNYWLCKLVKRQRQITAGSFVLVPQSKYANCV